MCLVIILENYSKVVFFSTNFSDNHNNIALRAMIVIVTIIIIITTMKTFICKIPQKECLKILLIGRFKTINSFYYFPQQLIVL